MDSKKKKKKTETHLYREKVREGLKRDIYC